MPSPQLWVVATPIGNPDDLSPRAARVLRDADLILAEDTRRAGRLLANAGIRPKKMISFFEHNEQERQQDIIAALREGAQIALVTDAGTPLLADPGYRLVRECRRLGLRVSPLPGPSAPIAALSAAGIAPIPFVFLGFLPRSASGCSELFQIYGSTPASLVFFERKNRLQESLKLAHSVLGEREFAICRELTKIHEEFIVGKLSQAAQLSSDLLGEITVVIAGREESQRVGEDEAERLLLAALSRGLRPRAAAREAKKQARGWSISELYALLQSLKEI